MAMSKVRPCGNRYYTLVLSLVAHFIIFHVFLSFPLITGADSGHALEAGWFLMLYGAQSGDKEIHRTAIRNFVELPYQYGWDKEHGGLFYFLDVDGHCPTQVNLSSLHMIMFLLDTILFQFAFNSSLHSSLYDQPCCFCVWAARVEHEAVVATLWGSHRVPHGLQSHQEAWAAGDILRSLPVHF